jgi:arginyl-tRNA synthetase
MNDPWSAVIGEILQSKGKAEQTMGCPEVPVTFAEPPEGHGDIGFSAFQHSKALGKDPKTVANELATAMEPGKLVSEYRSTGPYVNAYLNMANLSKLTLDTIMSLDGDYGSLPGKGLKVVLEHTSVNPTGPVHVGRARNPILGDTLARIMRKAGYDVTTEFYVNDVGKQVVMLAWGVMNLSEELPDVEGAPETREKADHQFVRHYRKAFELYEKDPEVKDEIDLMLQRFERGDKSLADHIEVIVEKMLEGMLSSLGMINIAIDKFVWESAFLRDKKVHEVVDRLKETQYCKEDEGATYLDIESFVPGQERYYLTRGDGTTLYTARDIAYHLDKFGRCDLAVNILGEDQKLGMQALKAGLKILGETRAPENVFYSFVSLPEGRMSTRKGVVVHLDDLVEDALERATQEIRKRRSDLGEEEVARISRAVGAGAVRYNIVKVQAEKSIVFRWEEALNFEGNSAPFIQYSHARCHGIIEKAAVDETAKRYDPTLLSHENEKGLVKLLARFPEIIAECSDLRKAHTLALYAYEVASAFNLFYRDCPVVSADSDLKNARLALVECSRIVIRNALECMGIEALSSM